MKFPTEQSHPPLESIDSTLAKNLIVARIIRGMTQKQLADVSNVSRATIAQLETGYSDPRLSTVVELARGLGLPAVLLLIGVVEVQALIKLPRRFDAHGIRVDPTNVARMKALNNTGLLKDRLQAARLGAASAGDAGDTAYNRPSDSELSEVIAAIFTAFEPGEGTITGAVLGRLLAAGAQ